MYSYVTGAGSWTIFLMLTQVYGIRGQLGDLLIEPKLVKEQYDSGEVLTVDTLFAEKVCVSFITENIWIMENISWVNLA